MPQERSRPENELNDLEAALGSLAPAASRLDRDSLMFHAGKISAGARKRRRRDIAWPAIAASLALIAIGEAFVIHHQYSMQMNKNTIVVESPKIEPISPRQGDSPSIARTEANSAAVKVESRDRDDGFTILGTPRSPLNSLQNAPSWLGESEYERLRRQVTTFGVDALPASPSLAVSTVASSTPAPAVKPQTSAELLRHELTRLLDPGESL